MRRLEIAFLLALKMSRQSSRAVQRDERGQAMVESAIVIPLMVFLILGVIQLVMVQHARIMTEYAAFNAARAGIVWNADRIIMEDAALISLLPTYENLYNPSDRGNPVRILKHIMQRALIYQIHRNMPQAIDLLKNGAGQIIDQIPMGDSSKDSILKGKDLIIDALGDVADQTLQSSIANALGGGDDQMVSVEILNPFWLSFRTQAPNPAGQGGASKQSIQDEIDFDDPDNREETRLTIRVRYLYLMRIPFANWIIHQAWLSMRAGKQLYGAIWNPQENAPGETGFRNAQPRTQNAYQDPLLGKLDALGQQGYYFLPLEASYSMRMQSNPYRTSLAGGRS